MPRIKLKVYPYKMGSESARVLSRSLQDVMIHTRRVYSNGNYKYYPNHVILNWGNSILPNWNRDSVRWINTPWNVALSANKIAMLHRFKESTIPSVESTKDALVAKAWIDDGSIVYCRTKVCSSGGDGIVVATCVDELVDAPLYTKGVHNDKEYRVHVFNGKVIDFTRKGRKRVEDSEDRPSNLVRNHTKGWVFIREGVQLPKVVEETAIAACSSLGLIFGGVDICTIKGTEESQVCVFEVNTACGMQEGGTTLLRYTEAITSYLREL